MDITLATKLHLAFVAIAIILGFLNLALDKGTPRHKINGKIWVVLMLLTAFTSFFIMPTGSLTWLHLFALVVIISVTSGVFAIRKKNMQLHIRCMIGAYIGTVISAIVAASIPGRLLYELLY